MTSGLTVRHEENGVIFLAGELSLAEAPVLERQLADALEASTSSVVLDLTDVEFIDSTGLSVLIRAQRRAAERGISFGVQNPRAQALRVLSLTGLADRLTVPDHSAPKPQA